MQHRRPNELSIVDVDQVRAEISHHERAIATLEARMDDLFRSVRQLQYQKLSHQDQIRKAKGLITLARRLPPDILALIIQECQEDGRTRTPLTIAHVCSEWRRVINIPSVWTYIYVNCDSHNPVPRTQFWMQKARQSDLNITIEIRNDTTHLAAVMQLLLASVSQWKTLSIKSLFLPYANAILSMCYQTQTPLLSTLEVAVTEPDTSTDVGVTGLDPLPISRTFTNSPLLKNLRISHNILPRHGSLPSSITNLYLSLPSHQAGPTLSLAAIISLLGDLPLLSYLNLLIPHQQQLQLLQHLDQTFRIEIPHLDCLVLSGPPEIFRLLPHLITPNIKSLHLRSSMDLPDAPFELTGEDIISFAVSNASVRTLELRDIDISPQDISTLLASFPDLSRIHLHESEIDDSVLQELESSSNICPLLTELDFRWCSQLRGSALVNFVHSRMASASPVERVTVINCALVREDDVLALAGSTVCCVVPRADDYCRGLGCCQNERYRRRLQLRHNLPSSRTGRLII